MAWRLPCAARRGVAGQRRRRGNAVRDRALGAAAPATTCADSGGLVGRVCRRSATVWSPSSVPRRSRSVWGTVSWTSFSFHTIHTIHTISFNVPADAVGIFMKSADGSVHLSPKAGRRSTTPSRRSRRSSFHRRGAPDPTINGGAFGGAGSRARGSSACYPRPPSPTGSPSRTPGRSRSASSRHAGDGQGRMAR